MALSWASSPCQRRWDGGLPGPSHQDWGGGEVAGWTAVGYGGSDPHEVWMLIPGQTQSPASAGGCKDYHQLSGQHGGEAVRRHSHHPSQELSPHGGWGGCLARSPDRCGNRGCSGRAGAGTRHWWRGACTWCRCNCWAHIYLKKQETHKEKKNCNQPHKMMKGLTQQLTNRTDITPSS